MTEENQLTPEQKVKQAYKEFFTSKAGKLVMDDLCGLVQINASPYVRGVPEDTAYNSGRQDVVHHIMVMIDSSLRKEVESRYGIDEFE